MILGFTMTNNHSSGTFLWFYQESIYMSLVLSIFVEYQIEYQISRTLLSSCSTNQMFIEIQVKENHIVFNESLGTDFRRLSGQQINH